MCTHTLKSLKSPSLVTSGELLYISVLPLHLRSVYSHSVMEYSKPVQAEQYSVETSQLVTGHTLSTENYSTALVSLTTCVASPLLYHHTQPCTTRADNYCILVWAHGEKKIIHTDTNSVQEIK